MNRDDNKISIEEIHKEIDLIQSCITRMAQNSFMLKGWFVSIYAVILALLPEKVNMFLLCIALLAVNLIFWYLSGNTKTDIVVVDRLLPISRHSCLSD